MANIPEEHGKNIVNPANALTVLRIVCALCMIFFPAFSAWFYVCYIAGGVTDVLDGFIARRFRMETKLGSRLDTAADIIFTVVTLIKVLSAVSVPVILLMWIIIIAVIKCINVIIGFVLYKRFIPEHTVMNKTCGIAIFFIPPCLGLLPEKAGIIAIIAVCALSTFAAVQEGHYIRTGKEIR